MGFTLGFYFGRTQHGSSITVSVSPSMQTLPLETIVTPDVTETVSVVTFPIHLNQATKDELMALPGIGDVLADRILSYRLEHGSFSCVTDLMHVEGIGEKRMEEILDLITTGG